MERTEEDEVEMNGGRNIGHRGGRREGEAEKNGDEEEEEEKVGR